LANSIRHLQKKPLTGTQAALAYANGIGPDDIREDGTAVVNGIVIYDLKDPVGLRNAVRASSLNVNPITETNWDGGDPINDLSARERAIFADARLNTGAAQHHAFLLLAHLRAAKKNQPLDFATNN